MASFPSSVWDGVTDRLVGPEPYAGPEASDWLEIIDEVKAMQTQVRPPYDEAAVLWVAPWGVAATANGSLTNPYRTLAAAFAAITSARKIVLVMPGTYTLTGVQALPVAVSGVKIIGVGSVTVVGANANQAFSLTPGAQGAAFEITLENINVTQYAAKKGLYIDDTAIDGTVTVNINKCNFTMSASGSSIDLLHAVNQAVHLNASDCLFTGPITLDCINTDDIFTFTRCNLANGLSTDTGAVAAWVVLKDTEVKHAGITGGNAAQEVHAINCWTTSGAFDSKDTAGSHTQKISGNLFTAGAATPAVALRIGATITEGLEVTVYDEIITLTNAVKTATTLTLPAGAVVLSAQLNLQTLVAGDASGDDALAKIGLGITGTAVKYGVTSALTQNAKIDKIPDWAVLSGTELLEIFGIKADGSTECTEKFTAGATVRVRVVYLACNSLDNA